MANKTHQVFFFMGWSSFLFLVLGGCQDTNKAYQSPVGMRFPLKEWPDSAYIKSQDFTPDSSELKTQNTSSAPLNLKN